MRLNLLGRPTVVVDGAERPWPTTRPDALLTVLAVRGGWVRRDELALLFQPDRRDAEARAWVRQAIYRAGARPWAGALEQDGDALRWAVASDLGDVRAALARGDVAAAVAGARGPLLEDWDPGDPATSAWLDGERARLHDAWTTAVAPWAQAREEGGDAAAALAAYRAWQRLDPDDEQAVQGELRALHASQGAAAARRRFRTHARQLRAELDTEPDPATAALAVAEPRRALPVPPRRSLGRDALRTAAVARLTERRVPWLTLHGRAGMGASLVGLEAAWVAADAFAGGTVAVAARALQGGGATADALAEALGIAGAEPAQVARRLRAAPTLLWLDAGEARPAAGAAADLAAWLDAAPGSAWLVAGRGPVGHPRETALEVPGLAPQDARALFLERAEAVAPGFALGPGDTEALDALVAHVGGWPLALEVAAAWVATVPVRVLAARLDPLLAAPDGADADAPVVRALDAAHDRLDAGAAEALAAFAAFADPFDADAAEAVGGAAALPALARLRRAGLAERGVDGRHRVHALVAADAARRHPAAADVGRRAHRRWWARRSTAWAAALRGGDPVGAGRAIDDALPELERAFDQAAADAPADDALADALALAEARFQHAAVRGRERAVAPLLARVDALLEAHGAPAAWRARARGWWAYVDLDAPLTERLGRLDDAAALADAADPADGAANAFARVAAANLLHRDGRTDDATAAAEAGVALAEAARDAHVAAWGAHLRGVIGFARDEDAGVLEGWFGRALAHAATGGDVGARALALANLGELALAQGDHDAAEARYQGALEALRALADPRLAAVVTGRLGRLALRRGDPDAADRHLDDAAAELEALADDRGLAAVAQDRAAVALARGDLDGARRALRAAVARALDGGETAVALDAAVGLADLDADAERARAWLERLHGWARGVHGEVAAAAAARLAARGVAAAADRAGDDAATFDDAARHRLRAFAAG